MLTSETLVKASGSRIQLPNFRSAPLGGERGRQEVRKKRQSQTWGGASAGEPGAGLFPAPPEALKMAGSNSACQTRRRHCGRPSARLRQPTNLLPRRPG